MSTIKQRLARRFNLKLPLRFRPLSNPATPEQQGESLNLSQSGVYFATDFPLKVGMPVELFLNMPRELTGLSATEVRCVGQVIHIQGGKPLDTKFGVGVHIERYEPISTSGRQAG